MIDAAPAPWIEIRNVTAESADVFLYSSIGMTDEVPEQLARLSAITSKTVNVRINSPGGSVFGGFAVINALARLDAEIVVYIDGMAASIASAIAMAGDRIVMAENAMIMIHSPSGSASGSGDDLRNTAAMLDQLRGNISALYQKRSGQHAEAIAALMETDSWLTAAECLARGFCTEIAPSIEISAAFDLSGFKNVPSQILNMSKQNDPAASAAPAVTSTAPAVETFTAEAVTAKVQAAERTATEAAHAAAKVKFDAAQVEATATLNSVRAELNNKIAANAATITAQATEIDGLKKKLSDAEAMSASKLGVSPVAHVSSENVTGAAAKVPSTPGEILAHYRGLTGDARSKYFDANKDAIWTAHESEMTQPR